jgi:hypothetical protein
MTGAGDIAAIAAALGGAHRSGRDWRCRCPVHGGTSLSLAGVTAGSCSSIVSVVAIPVTSGTSFWIAG